MCTVCIKKPPSLLFILTEVNVFIFTRIIFSEKRVHPKYISSDKALIPRAFKDRNQLKSMPARNLFHFLGPFFSFPILYGHQEKFKHFGTSCMDIIKKVSFHSRFVIENLT